MTTSYWERRLRRHAGLALSSLGIGAVIWTQSPHRSLAEEISFATAYSGLVLLAIALALGPLKLLRRRSNPVSTDLRRDVGIWAAVNGIAHTIAGLQVHMHGRVVRYFFPAAGAAIDRSTAAFLTANYLGLTGAILLIVLMSISNDFALRRLGVDRWKFLQRSSYVALAAIVLHGIAYQLLEKRSAGLAVLFGSTAAVVVALQIAGARAHSSRTSFTSESSGPEDADPR
jgi:sulfoxide reductase heme-binding subunit YedZ